MRDFSSQDFANDRVLEISGLGFRRSRFLKGNYANPQG